MENTDINNKDKDCLDPENNSKYCFFKVANAFLLFAVFLLFVTLCFYAPRVISGKSLGFDYMGVIVAVLGILITALITWQIWQTIISRREVEKATKTANRLNKLESELNQQRNIYESRNLEIKHLIDAHARLHEADNERDLSYKYILYAEAIRLLIQSNMDMTYEQFENARHGLFDTLRAFQSLANDDKIEDFINSEREYERYYQLLMSLLTKQSEEVGKFKLQLARIRELRLDAIEAMKNSKAGKRIKQRAAKRKKKMQEDEKRLHEKIAAREAAQEAAAKKEPPTDEKNSANPDSPSV